MRRLLVIAGLLGVGTACVDMHLRLELARDGSGRLRSDLTLGPRTTELFFLGGGHELINQLVPVMPELSRRDLRAAGVRRLQVSSETGEQLSSHTDLRFSDLSAIDRMIELKALQSPHFTLEARGGGTWELSAKPADASDDPVVGRGSEGALDGLATLGEDQVTALTLGLLGEVSTFRLVIELEVPGEVVEVSPIGTVEVDGSTVRWTYDMQSLSGPLLAGLRGGQGPPPGSIAGTLGWADDMRVRFMPTRPLPEKGGR